MHYADLAVYHTVYGLRAMKQKNLSRLYLMCYAHYRYLKISDHVVNSFSHKVNYYKGEAETYQAKAICDVKDEDKDHRNAAAAILIKRWLTTKYVKNPMKLFRRKNSNSSSKKLKS